MIATSQMIMLAIQAGVRLYSAGRKVYIQDTLDRSITLPLPSGPGINTAAARNFFKNDEKGKIIAKKEENRRIKDLLLKGSDLTHDEKSELILIYQTFRFETDPNTSPGSLEDRLTTGNELVAILTIRNWHEDSPGPTKFQLIAGTLVNIAVDYFAYTPGAISDKRPEGRALKHFLEALDTIDFAVKPPGDVIADVMLAVIDSVANTPSLIGNTATQNALVENIATAMSLSAEKHLAWAPSSERWEGRQWLQMISFAIVKGGTQTVLANPQGVLGVGKNEGQIIKMVGESMADLVLGDGTLDMKPLLSGDGLEIMVKSVLTAVSKNPGFINIGSKGLKAVLISIAEELSEVDDLFSDDIFPKLAGMALVHSARNLELIWPEGADDPQKHLLITATRVLFTQLSERVAQGRLPTLSREHVLELAETIFDEVLENRAWVLEEFEGNPRLHTVIEAALTAFEAQERGSRLTEKTLMLGLRAGIKASALNLSLLDRLESSGADQGKIALTAAIDAIFDSLTGEEVSAKVQWHRARQSALHMALETGLAKIAKIGADQKHIIVLRTKTGPLIDKQLSLEDFAQQLENQLLTA